MGMIEVATAHGVFTVDPETGRAALRPASGDEAPIWTGTILPSLHLQSDRGPLVRHATATVARRGEGSAHLELSFGDAGSGSAVLRFGSAPAGGAVGLSAGVTPAPDTTTAVEGGVVDGVTGATEGAGPVEAGVVEAGVTDAAVVELAELRIALAPGLALRDLFFGLSALDDAERQGVPDPDYPEWPDWQAGAFCVPGIRPAPATAIARRWDLGQATVALGQFGPALGAPYAAAFPRPVWSAGFGDDRGWLVAGPGEVPDAALTLDVRSTSGALRWRYRDDLWGPPAHPRTWAAPLRLTWGPNPVDAFARFFATFPARPEPARPAGGLSAINTWGDFRRGDFDVLATAATAAELGAQAVVIDDGWESFESSGHASSDNIPDLDAVREGVHAAGLEIGFWQSVGWVPDPAGIGLSDDDVLAGRDGSPALGNWGMDPRDPVRHHVLDPSSPRARAYLADRIQRIVRDHRPALLKLDFGYGLPGPDQAAPRDPEYRGERMGHALYRIAADAARAADPHVAIQLYGIHPLHTDVADVVALDDMGDHGAHDEGLGHRRWSVWAALAGPRGVGLSGSSGYSWEQDRDSVLDSFVLGGAGIVLPLRDPAHPPTERQLALRRASFRWSRPTAAWHPLFLDGPLGAPEEQPEAGTWARVEDGVITAVCLRSAHPHLDGHSPDGTTGLGLADLHLAEALQGWEFEGDWAVVALGAPGDGGVGRAPVAVIPATPGRISLPGRADACQTRWDAEVGTGTDGQAPGAGAPDGTLPSSGGRRGEGAAGATTSDGPLTLVADEAALDAGLQGWTLY
ncbi:hypothetical protein N1031_07505 [Herbiconiux moechotypicola]|uniref:Alpha-galactosidase n=1 Tax=Herbiconiux moechotypicola TaxID=637393 RepID=A0ABN3DHH4_9MICO|nr:hypothetical protein [Herbiconiux moechotypicola]MCS5729604.1 hypothetical protein [Herbiconiux moechotypicola]